MHPVLRQADRFQDLLALRDHDAPYAFETIFDDASWRARRLSKRKFKLMRGVDEKLRSMLREGERVRYVTFGSAVSFLESYFLGWALYYINRRAILLTDRRIILLQIDSRRRPRKLVEQVRYPAIVGVKRTILGAAKFRLGDGKSRVISGVPGRDRKFLRDLTEWTGQSMERETVGLEHLCPHCYVVVEGRPRACSSCGGRFKSARRAGLLSLLFPGLGDIYMGHWKFAIGEVAFGALIWLAVLLPNPQNPTTPTQFLALAAFVVVVFHGADAVVTWLLARKAVYPAKGSRAHTSFIRGTLHDAPAAAAVDRSGVAGSGEGPEGTSAPDRTVGGTRSAVG